MTDDERTQHISNDEPETARISAPSEQGPVATAPSRWDTVTEPARRHPIGVAVGSAIVGLAVGLLGGIAVDAHPQMSLTVGTAPTPAAFDGPAGPPPPPGPDHHGPHGPGGPGGPGELPPPPPPPNGGPSGPGERPAPAPPQPQPGADAPGPGAPQTPPLPAERGGTA
jgi:hypothetical protein